MSTSMFRSGFYKYMIQGYVDRTQGDELAAQVMSDVDTAGDVEALRRRVIQQSLAIEELASVVAVMSRMLIEAGQIDAKVLEYRVDAALDERRAPPEAPVGTCVLCGRERPGSAISRTAFGAVCSGGCPAR
ncbi:MAG: hypothetical protein H0T46_31960 [Deltaproteobacteria bacterium]|nr:hypothetical protein [Deltaproteobacteria bacterium]